VATPYTLPMQLDVCREQVEWATAEKRTFLRQRIEARLVALQLQSRNFTAALSLIGKLLTEVHT
jgi:26S proteasome regulatory subunit N6